MYSKQLLVSIALLFCAMASYAQQLPDSLWTNYRKEHSDTGKLKTMWYIIHSYLDVRPDSALLYASRSLALATKIHSIKYLSLTYKQMGDAYKLLGDYPNALTSYINRLEMDEKENDAYKIAITYNNLGIVYGLENEDSLSLAYYQKAEKIITDNKIEELESLININLCDAYEKRGDLNKAFLYGKKALAEAYKTEDTLNIAIGLNNLGNVFYKEKQPDSALLYYNRGIPFAKTYNSFQTLCETYLGIAQIMQEKTKTDSAIYYAALAATVAKNMGYSNYYLQSCTALSDYFSHQHKYDSAYFYLSAAREVKEENFNDEKAKRVQLLTINEEVRQEKLKEAQKKAAEDRSHALQLLAIGMLIPIFFLLSVLLSKRKIKPRVIELTGILSLLMFFEYITLLIHPAIQKFTNDTPVYEIIILMIVAAILTPAHHRIEEWLLHKLSRVHHKENLHIITKKIQQKKQE